jgi:hypothetical protein
MCSISYYFRNSSASINNVTNVNSILWCCWILLLVKEKLIIEKWNYHVCHRVLFLSGVCVVNYICMVLLSIKVIRKRKFLSKL